MISHFWSIQLIREKILDGSIRVNVSNALSQWKIANKDLWTPSPFYVCLIYNVLSEFFQNLTVSMDRINKKMRSFVYWLLLCLAQQMSTHRLLTEVNTFFTNRIFFSLNFIDLLFTSILKKTKRAKATDIKNECVPTYASTDHKRSTIENKLYFMRTMNVLTFANFEWSTDWLFVSAAICYSSSLVWKIPAFLHSLGFSIYLSAFVWITNKCVELKYAQHLQS